MNDPKPAQYIDVLGIDTRLRYLTPAERIREYRQAVAPYEAQLVSIHAHSLRPLIVRPINMTIDEAFGNAIQQYEIVEVGPLPVWAQEAEGLLRDAIDNLRKLYLSGL